MEHLISLPILRKYNTFQIGQNLYPSPCIWNLCHAFLKIDWLDMIWKQVADNPRNDRTVNGNRNDQLSTTVKTLVSCSSASAWVLLWMVSKCTLYSADVKDDWTFHISCTTCHKHCMMVFSRRVCMYVHMNHTQYCFYYSIHMDSMQTVFIHGTNVLKLEWTENVWFVLGNSKLHWPPTLISKSVTFC